MANSGRVHDRAILDALENMDPIAVDATVWRITGVGRDPIRGSAANGRWSPGGNVEVLYTSLEQDGALAEIGFRLSLEPVWPSRLQHVIHKIAARTGQTLRFADVPHLGAYGVDTSKYESFDCESTQALAAAAHFLQFDGLLVPGTRHRTSNLVIFMDGEAAASLEVKQSAPVDWSAWRKNRR